ncbi:MAG: hypothetical protein GW778_04280 [Alphaproteobacteria bacterium]|nr:hypothetical protein [Alphaproteobacteria bacterium]
MALISGASGYLNAATLANSQGRPAQPTTLLSNSSVDILDVARANAPSNGVGLSSRARQLNQQFLNSTASTFNQIFSLGLGSSASIEGMQQQILALRARTPTSALSREVAQSVADGKANTGSSPIDEAVQAAEKEAKAASDSLASSSSTLTSSGRAIDAEA